LDYSRGQIESVENYGIFKVELALVIEEPILDEVSLKEHEGTVYSKLIS
jgi:hypothetical protein